jgi:hypothetical protein
MSLSDVLGFVALGLAVAAWIFPNAMSPIRIKFERWRKDSQFTGAKRQLRTIRRKIAYLKRSRTSRHKTDYLIALTFYSVCFLGFFIALINFLSFEQSIQYRSGYSQKLQIISLFAVCVFYTLTFFGRRTWSSRSYREKLLKLKVQRLSLVKELNNAKTN